MATTAGVGNMWLIVGFDGVDERPRIDLERGKESDARGSPEGAMPMAWDRDGFVDVPSGQKYPN